MKLFRYGDKGAERPAILDSDGRGRALDRIVDDIKADNISDEMLAHLREQDAESLPLIDEGERIGPCVADIQRFFCIGLNYSDHAAEAGMAVPEKPILFMKVCEPTGPNDTVRLPRGSSKSDWEVELGVVIGKGGRHIAQADAFEHVAGYCVVNDLSEREFQLEHGGQWVKGKSCDGFGPVGPYLVTRDEIADPQALSLWLDVNGERKQTGTSANMVFTVAQVISHLSQFMTLRAGDLISTGTPPGVGMGLKPQQFLKAGDEVRLGIDGLGEQQQIILSAD